MDEALDAKERAIQAVRDIGKDARDLYIDLLMTKEEVYEEEGVFYIYPYAIIDFKESVYGRRRLLRIRRDPRLDIVESVIKEIERLLGDMNNRLRFYRESGEIPRDRVGKVVRQLFIANQNVEKKKLELALSDWKGLQERIMTGTEPARSFKPSRQRVLYDWL
jgi:hypothetical protein